MKYVSRLLEDSIQKALTRGKSVLFIGPRQTGKTTLILERINPDIKISFATASVRRRYEDNPEVFAAELQEEFRTYPYMPLVFLDEIQKVPKLMDSIQDFIDNKQAKFIISGSSARKLKYGTEVNLLPGRVVCINSFPLLYSEYQFTLEEVLVYGSLPGIISVDEPDDKEIDLNSYVSTYLEEEIRAEAVVRNLGHFSRFLQLAAGESGLQVNFSKISQEVGVADTTIANYYQILEDCLIANRIDPVTKSTSKRRLIKSPKYLFFDLGVRRVAANEGPKISEIYKGQLFEQYVGNSLIALAKSSSQRCIVKYWRDTDGPEVDYVLEKGNHLTPIEVKWTDMPKLKDARHLIKFMQEYQSEIGYIVCRTPKKFEVAPQSNIFALPWQEIPKLL